MSKATILVVEDSSVMQIMYKDVLGSKYNLEIANHGKDGLDRIKDKAEIYDLVISDLYMPVMDGIDFVKRLRNISRYDSVPIIMVSSVSDILKKEVARRVGANGWILKPVKEQRLLSAINTLIN